MAGLSRSKDYGSKKKPYPSVSKKDFAGGGRSYPIPTKADAIDALRLAGLHGRSDVRSKVYNKYPELKKAMGGYVNNKSKSGKAPILPWSGVVNNQEVNPMNNDFALGGLVLGGISMATKLIGGIVNKRREAKAAEEQAQLEEYNLKQDTLNKMPPASKGVVPGVANPYMLALGGLTEGSSGRSDNPQETLTEYDAGGLHEENPLGGVPIGMTKKGKQNTVEEGEASFKFEDGKYIFSNRLIV